MSKASHHGYDGFGCAILTHGEEDDTLYASDGSFKLSEITEFFTTENCPTLAGKPKLFFIQVRLRCYEIIYTSTSIAVARGGRGPGPSPIEMLPMIKMSQTRLLSLQFQFFLASSRTTVYSRTTVINNNIDPGGPSPLNLIFANQFKNTPYNNI